MKSALFTCFTFALLLTSCQVAPCSYSKTRFLKNYAKLVDNASKADRKISDKIWDRYDKKFENFAIDCYEAHADDMSFAEQRDFWIDAVRYLVYRYGWSIISELQDPDTQNEIIGVVRKNAMEVLDGIDDLAKVIKNELTNSSKWKKLLDDIKNKANEIGE